MQCSGERMVGCNCTEGRNAFSLLVPGAAQKILEFANLVTAVNGAGFFVVLDDDRVSFVAYRDFILFCPRRQISKGCLGKAIAKRWESLT